MKSRVFTYDMKNLFYLLSLIVCLSVSADAGSKTQPSQEQNKHEKIERPKKEKHKDSGRHHKKPRKPRKLNN